MSDKTPGTVPTEAAVEAVRTNGEDAQRTPGTVEYVLATASLYTNEAGGLQYRAHVAGDRVPKENVARYKHLGWAENTEPIK